MEIDKKNQIEQKLNQWFEKIPTVSYFLFTKSNCKYCDYTKLLLDDNFLEYGTANCDEFLENNETKNIFLNFIENKIGRRYTTFPMIFCENIFVGGFSDLTNKIA